MDNKKERIDQQRCKSYKETKHDNVRSEIRTAFLKEITDHGNVNVAAIWETRYAAGEFSECACINKNEESACDEKDDVMQRMKMSHRKWHQRRTSHYRNPGRCFKHWK